MSKLQVNLLRNECPIPFRKELKKILQFKIGLPLDGPKRVWIDITNECNLRCIMCPQSKGLKRKKMMMEPSAFVRIVDQISREKPLIFLHVSGEPLLHKDLFEMIAYAKSKDCYVIMHTNATLLTDEISMNILQSNLDFISFSFDGCSPEIYERLRVGANFEQVRSQILSFLKLRHKLGLKKPKTRIEILYMEATKDCIQDFISNWGVEGMEFIGIRPVGDWLGLIEGHGAIKPKNFGHRICDHVFYSCAILVDGTIVPCCMDVEGRLPLGNISRQPFHEIWNGPLYNQLRKQHIVNAIPSEIICRDCSFARSWSKRERFAYLFLRQLLNS